MHRRDKTVAGVWQRHSYVLIILALLPSELSDWPSGGQCPEPMTMIGPCAPLVREAWLG